MYFSISVLIVFPSCNSLLPNLVRVCIFATGGLYQPISRMGWEYSPALKIRFCRFGDKTGSAKLDCGRQEIAKPIRPMNF